jgi:diamine N-acetyltransferase
VSDVYLRPLALRDANLMLEWIKDPSVNQWFAFDADRMTIESVTTFISENSSYTSASPNRHFAICTSLDEYCGTISLKNIDHASQNAEYAIALRQNMQGQEIGTSATRAILNYAFEELHLHKVYLFVLPHNQRAIRFYEKMGFVYTGESIAPVVVKGVSYFQKCYRILASEYTI